MPYQSGQIISALAASTGDHSDDLIEDAGIAGLYTAETGNVIWAGTINPPFGSINEGSTVSFTIKVLTGNFSGSAGQAQVFNLKAVTGGKRSGVWVTDDPENIFDFASVSNDKYNKNITVTKVDDIIAPNPVSPIVVSLNSNSPFVSLSWSEYNEDDQGDVVKYRIYRSETDFTDVSNMTPIGEVTFGNFFFGDYWTIPGNGYHYAVTAVDEIGNENPAVSTVYIFVSVLDLGATISGTVYQSNGSTPLTGKNVTVFAYTGSPCGSQTSVGSASVNSTNGTYTITSTSWPFGMPLPAGTYYLKTYSSENFFIEWWASQLSVRDCAGAQPIVVTDGQAVIGKDFQLDPYSTISGTIYQSDGVTPLTGKSITVTAYTGSPCGSLTGVGNANINPFDGTYTISGLLAGTYYLKNSSSENYYDEWWASPLSVRDCAGAQPIVVTEGQVVAGINFQPNPVANISGTVYQTNGSTPLTGKLIYVTAYTGSPCGILTRVGSANSFMTGTYTISGLPAGTYYLQAGSPQFYDNYIDEWWASPLSVRDCSGAQPIVVTEEQTVTNINFQLDPGATISGTIYQSDGVTPLIGKSVTVTAYTGSPCGTLTKVGYVYINSTNGTYTIKALPSGTYYLQTYSSENYFNEWWASPLSVRDCAGAQPIVVTEGQAVSNKNFRLDPGATISGTIYQSDGVTPLTGKSIRVYAYTGSPCSFTLPVGSAIVNSTNGTYSINVLPAGTYYLKTFSLTENYVEEWWASPLSVKDCAGAQPIVVTEGQTVTNKNFQLAPGATISGTMYQSDGVTPITGKSVTVTAYTGSPCGSLTRAGSASVNSTNGAYTIHALPAGTYYLHTSSSENYLDEWWASPLSVRDCAGAQSIVVAERKAVTGKNFQLDPGATISGTIYQSDGVTPITGKSIYVYAYTGSPCGSKTWAGTANVNSTNGIYTIHALPAGTYYLQTSSSENYVSEWWASPLSVWDCAGAQPIVVAERKAVTGKNFQLDQTSLTISGIIRTGTGTPIAGVTVTFSNGGGTVTTDAGGKYTKSVVSGYSGTATPSKVGYLFTPATRTYSNVIANQAAQNYIGKPSPIISGSIKNGTGTAISGAKVTFSNGGGTATTDAGGNYSLTVASGYSGTATPSKVGYLFTPATRTYSNVIANQAAQNYTGKVSTRTISGSIKTGTGTAISGVTVTFSNGGGTVTTDASGNYSKTVGNGYSGTATPSKSGYIFTPATIAYSNVTANKTAQNYTGAVSPIISGSIKTGTGTAISGVKVTFSNGGGTVTTDASGNYSQTVIRGYSGTATPSKVGYSFTPKTKTYSNVIANKAAQNYVGVATGAALQLWGAWADGVWTWEKASGEWTKIPFTEDALMIASGNVYTDSYNDLIGVWSSGLWVYNSSNGQWVHLTEKLPTWIAAGDINDDGLGDIIGTWEGDGTYYRDSATGKWIKIAASAKQLAVGKFNGPGDDLIGVWESGLWVRNSLTAEWQKIDAKIPRWISRGNITDSTRDEIIASYANGTWIWKPEAKTWAKITDPVEQLAMGDLDGDGRDDMIAVFPTGLQMILSSTAEWQPVKSSKPTWITTGLIEDSILTENSKQDPKGSKAGILDLTNEGPGGAGFNAEVLNESGPELME